MCEIIPGILEKEWVEIERKIELVKPFAKTIQIDIVDGKFADNITFLDPEPFKKYSSDLFLELHMMVEEPIDYLDEWAAAGFRRFIGHIEKMSDQVAFVAKAQQLGEVGLAIDGPTSQDKLEVSGTDLDTILIMTIKAGISGQQFQEERLEKVKQLLKRNEFLSIEVDGGINLNTINIALKAGVKKFAVTSGIFASSDPAEAYRKLEEACKNFQLLVNS